jgi:hypothetical protein
MPFCTISACYMERKDEPPVEKEFLSTGGPLYIRCYSLKKQETKCPGLISFNCGSSPLHRSVA